MRTKYYLVLLTAVCLGMALRPFFAPPPVHAMAVGGGMPMPSMITGSAAPSLSTSNGIAYVVSDGKITAYEVRNHKLTQAGESLPVPSSPFAPQQPQAY